MEGEADRKWVGEPPKGTTSKRVESIVRTNRKTFVERVRDRENEGGHEEEEFPKPTPQGERGDQF